MAQQINLCTPILLTEKRYLSAATVVQALAAFLLVGGALFAGWVWSLKNSSTGFQAAMARQTQEIHSLQSAIAQNGKGTLDTNLQQQIASKHQLLTERTEILAALRNGLMQPGAGHSDRLRWVAASIPGPVWVTRVAMEEGRFELTGFTYEPAALNDWVSQLAASPLLRDMQLSAVKVVRVDASDTSAQAAAIVSRATWSFSLVSAQPPTLLRAITAGGPP
jgi:Tfp pilus assembly protein PilN